VINKYKNPLILAACLGIVFVLFTVDALTPSGATPAIGYCIVPLLMIQTGAPLVHSRHDSGVYRPNLGCLFH
jgi:hypothetical protein